MSFQINSVFSRENVFSFLQRLSQSFMLPIAMMPIVGFLLAIGSSFTQDITVANLGLTAIIHDGTILYQILTLMKTIGKLIMDNLSLLFAISVAIGFSDRKKEIAAFSAIISFVVMHQSINYLLVIGSFITAAGEILPGANEAMFIQVLGITSLQIGVFGGILLGLIVAILNNKYKGIGNN